MRWVCRPDKDAFSCCDHIELQAKALSVCTIFSLGDCTRISFFKDLGMSSLRVPILVACFFGGEVLDAAACAGTDAAAAPLVNLESSCTYLPNNIEYHAVLI